MINILADKYLYELSSFLPEEVNLQHYDPEEGLPEPINQPIDALLIRTVTAINEKTLNRLPDSLKFIGTGSAGTDHIDTGLLRARNIHYASAAGCNAHSVAEYVATALLLWADKRSHDLSRYAVGIIGAGHVGSALEKLLTRLEIPVVVYDPPRALREAGFTSAELKEVLDADILTFHVPLTITGDHPTYHWLDSEKLGSRTYELVINTARGGVVDEQALLQARSKGSVKDMIIDVWEEEPVFSDQLARQAFIKTPHIAGYSIQAKLMASKLICDELIKYFDLSTPETDSSTSAKKPVSLPESVTSISEVMTSIHPVLQYQQELTALVDMPTDQKAFRFNKLRAEFPLRNEFPALDIPTSIINRYPYLQAFIA